MTTAQAQRRLDRADDVIEANLIANLIKQGMPAGLAPLAVANWLTLIESSPNLLKVLEDNEPGIVGPWAQYCFMQGFVAGHTQATRR